MSLSLGIGFFGAVSGCDKSESSDSSDANEAQEKEGQDSSKDQAMAVDPNLAKAVAAASANAAKGKAPSRADQQGPPEGGIFAPGEADKHIKPGEPAKITLGSDGTAPRLDLSGATFAPGKKTQGTVQVVLKGDPRQGGLPIDFELQMASKAGASQAEATKPAPVLVTATVKSAKVAAAGSVPPDLVRRIGALKGAKVNYEIYPNGAATGFRHELPPGAEPGLNEHVRALSDTLATVTLPYPDKPVGKGAYWMATSRDGVMGLDLVSYRLVKVESVSENSAHLSVSTKRYATSPKFDLTGLQGSFTLDEFKSTADGKLEVTTGSPVPRTGSVDLLLTANLIPKDKPEERGALTVQAKSRLNFEQ